MTLARGRNEFEQQAEVIVSHLLMGENSAIPLGAHELVIAAVDKLVKEHDITSGTLYIYTIHNAPKDRESNG